MTLNFSLWSQSFNPDSAWLGFRLALHWIAREAFFASSGPEQSGPKLSLENKTGGLGASRLHRHSLNLHFNGLHPTA